MARLRTLPEALAKAARADAGYLFLSADGGGDAETLVRRALQLLTHG